MYRDNHLPPLPNYNISNPEWAQSSWTQFENAKILPNYAGVYWTTGDNGHGAYVIPLVSSDYVDNSTSPIPMFANSYVFYAVSIKDNTQSPAAIFQKFNAGRGTIRPNNLNYQFCMLIGKKSISYEIYYAFNIVYYY